MNYQEFSHPPLTEGVEEWLYFHGSNGEGFIGYLPNVFPQKYLTLYTFGSKYRAFINDWVCTIPIQIGLRTNYSEALHKERACKCSTDDNLRVYSVLTKTPPKLLESWPSFIWPHYNTKSALVGVILPDVRQVINSENWPSILSVSNVTTLDVIGVDIAPELNQRYRQHKFHPGRQISVKTIEGPRTLKIAENWDDRLKREFPLAVRKWNDVLDIIEDK